MSELTIHDIDETVLEKLRQRAERNGVSIEIEARQAIADRVAKDVSFPLLPRRRENAWDVIQKLKARHGGGADIEPLDRAEWKDRPLDLGG